MPASLQTCAFLGLGTMGFAMAGHLSKSFATTVWNRTPEKAARWQATYGHCVAKTPAEAVAHADIVCLCLGRDEDVLEIVRLITPHLKAGAILVDHTTTSYALTQTVHKQWPHFVDAPVSGGEQGAVKGTLTIMMGGVDTNIAIARPALEAYSKTITHMGQVGMGQLAKMANQIAIAGVLQGLSEAVRFAEQQGLDTAKLRGALSGGAAQSWQMDNRAHTMGARSFDFGFAMDWMIKDLRYGIDQAQSLGQALPMAEATLAAYERLSTAGHGGKDTSALVLDKA